MLSPDSRVCNALGWLASCVQSGPKFAHLSSWMPALEESKGFDPGMRPAPACMQGGALDRQGILARAITWRIRARCDQLN